MSERAEIGDLYDRLLSAETNKLAKNDLTIHKKLRFPDEAFSDTNGWILDNINLPQKGHILDAGCGVGGTLFALLGDHRTGLGITLSQRQIAVANSHKQSLKLADRCLFRQQSYDDRLDQQFDLIISIEALIHSENLFVSIQNLSQHLKSAGQFLIIEDMAHQDLSNDPIANIWQKAWAIQNASTDSSYQLALGAAGLKTVFEVDFTPFVKATKWPSWLIQSGWSFAQILPTSWRGAKDIFIGGWALEHLYASDQVSYRAILAEKG